MTLLHFFLKTDEFIAKQKTTYINDSTYAYDLFTNNIIGITTANSSSTINIKLFSDAGFKNNFLIEQENVVKIDKTELDIKTDLSTTTSTSTGTETGNQTSSEIVSENNITYQSYLFEGLGYGQLIAKVPPKTEVRKDTFIYIRTVDGLKPVAKIINIDEDNKSTFTIVYAQLIVSPQNIYKVIFK